MVNKKGADLLMDINPNLDEIIAEENAVADTENGEEHITLQKEEVADHDDVFQDTQPKRVSPPNDEKKRGTATQRRPKGLSREERAKIKEEEARKKFEEKQKKREETAQRNRERARLRYYEQKEKKAKEEELKKKVEKEIPKKIVEETEKKMNNFQKQEVKQKVNNNMDFNTFANYMIKYETMKDHFKNQAKKEHEQKKPVEPAKPKYHPDNYPVHSIYRNKRTIPNNFF